MSQFVTIGDNVNTDPKFCHANIFTQFFLPGSKERRKRRRKKGKTFKCPF